ncbi:MAG: ATP-binding protein [Deltaproteobacteria bacterium]
MVKPTQILLVEDDPDVGEILSIVLAKAGFDVAQAASLDAARKTLASLTDVAVIVADKNLPDGSGLTLLEEARSGGRDAELVVITGYPSLDSAVQALRLGVYDYLEKPFRILDDVSATVRRASELRRMRRERDEARARAVNAERRATLVQVAAGLAHEVKNPLQGIGFACANVRSALEGAGLPDAVLQDVMEQVSLIDAESRRLRDLVEGVMDLARPSPRPKFGIAARQFVREIVRLNLSRAEQAGVTLDFEVTEGLGFVADEADLSRALDNLVRNAIEVAPRGTGVRVMGTLEPGWVVLAVTDEGPGFSADDRARAFTPFFTTKARGFGLGLCMVAAAADRAGGSVEIRDSIPRGTCVVLRVPIEKEGA